MIDLEYLKPALDGLDLVLTIALFIYVRFAGSQRATRRLIRELENRVDSRFQGSDIRLTKIETEAGRLPSRDELERYRSRADSELVRVHERIDEIARDIKDMQLMLGELYGLHKAAMKNEKK